METTSHPAASQRAFAPVQLIVSATVVTLALAAVSFGAVTSAKVLHQQVLAGNTSTR